LAVDPEKMKSLIAFKKRLEDQLERLVIETKEAQDSLDTVNSILLDKGFKRGDIKEVPVSPPSLPKEIVLPKVELEAPTVFVQRNSPSSSSMPIDRESVIPLKTMAEEPLAIIYFEKQSMHVLPDESKNFSVNTPPFENFLVEKIFDKMREKDIELVKAKQLSQDKMFAYNIMREGEHIREIVIHNVDEERLKELKSSIRWTFEKMYEKMKSS
jgi:hypothetical protein